MGGWSPRQRESHRGRRADALSVARNCASGPVSSTPQGAQAVHTATRAEPAEGVPCLAPSLRGSQDSPASRRTADNAGHFAWRDRAVREGAGGSRTAQGTAKPTPPSNGVSRTRIGARRGCVPGPTHLSALEGLARPDFPTRPRRRQRLRALRPPHRGLASCCSMPLQARVRPALSRAAASRSFCEGSVRRTPRAEPPADRARQHPSECFKRGTRLEVLGLP